MVLSLLLALSYSALLTSGSVTVSASPCSTKNGRVTYSKQRKWNKLTRRVHIASIFKLSSEIFLKRNQQIRGSFLLVILEFFKIVKIRFLSLIFFRNKHVTVHILKEYISFENRLILLSIQSWIPIRYNRKYVLIVTNTFSQLTNVDDD